MLSYLILSHISAQHVLDLIAQVYRPNDIYLVHMDAKAPAAEHRKLLQLSRHFSNILLVDPHVCSWGSWSLVKITLLGLRTLVQIPAWSHCILLSEQHYVLRDADEIAKSLPDHVSYVEANYVELLYEGSRIDIHQRFKRFYLELRGVGSFGSRIRTPHGVKIHHGSQWMVLSRRACLSLCNKPLYSWEPFSSSLLPDETAIQSVLLASAEAERGVVVNECKTFVAWPHRTDNNDLIASPATHREALASRAFFVRKRPADLISLRGEWTPKLHHLFDEEGQDADELAAKRECLVRWLIDLLAARGFRIVNMHGPFLYLQVRRPEWVDELFVCICTYDLVEAAVCAVLKRKTHALMDFQEGPISAHVLKVRAFDLFLSVQLTFDEGSSLVRLDDQPADKIIERIEKIADQLHSVRDDQFVRIIEGHAM